MMGFGTIAKKIFGTPNDRKIKATRPLVDAINALEPQFKALDDAAIRDKTRELRDRLEKGESLDDLLPEAFANAREAARRTLGLRPFDVQLMGGIFLHQGNISEMKTGEGKTLMATLPGLSQRADRARRPRRHRQRLPRPPRRRVDGPRLPRARPQRRRGRARHVRGGQEGRLRRRRHLCDQQRARLRLPARQHEGRPVAGAAARSLLRDRRRGRFDPDRRGADALDHLRPERGPLGALHRDRQADPQAHRRALRPRREDSARRRSPRTATSSSSAGCARWSCSRRTRRSTIPRAPTSSTTSIRRSARTSSSSGTRTTSSGTARSC